MPVSQFEFPVQTILVFVVLAVGALCIDLFSHRSNKELSLTNAAIWSVFWVAIAMAFAGYLYLSHGSEVASLFITGYALEKVLSVDNLFVMMAIFSWFSVPNQYRHRILYWGIIGAIVFRGIFVVIGTQLLHLGPYVEIVFALIVAWTAVMMLKSDGDSDEIEDYSQHIAYRGVKRLFPVWPKIVDHRFFLSQQQVNGELAKAENAAIEVGRGKSAWRYATPLFLCVAVIELSDVMFAFDSVPAIIAVSREPLIVYSAMMFAILGLRTLYFVLEALKRYLVHLEKAVIALLFFIAAKLALNASNHLFDHGLSISANSSLIVVLAVLALGVVGSLLFPPADEGSDLKST